jgi:transcriptional regulator with XRE-family HTH domain
MSEMTDRNIIGKKIKEIRKMKHISQEELSMDLETQGIHVDRTVIGRIENGSREIVDFEIKAIADALGVTIHSLFGIK